MTLYTNARLSIFDLADLLSLSEANIRKRVERGNLPAPVERRPHLVWDAQEFWAWYVAVRPKGYSPELVPIRYWPEEATPPAHVSHKSAQIEVTYRHSMGAVTLVYPANGGHPGWNGARIEAVVRGTLSPQGFDIDVRRPGSQGRDEISTGRLANIVGQRLPYWPSTLRFPSAQGEVLAVPARGAGNLVTLRRLSPLIEDLELRHLLEQQAQSLAHSAYESARSDLEYVEHGVLSGRPFTHLVPQAFPAEVPETESPEWAGELFRTVGTDPAVTVALWHARRAWGSALDGHRAIESVSAGQEGARAFVESLIPAPSKSVMLGHHFIAETESWEAYIHPRHPELLAVKSGDRLDYVAPRTLGPVGDDALLDLSDGSNPFVQYQGDWLPLPYNPYSATAAGYEGSGPKTLIEVIVAARTGRPSVRDFSEVYERFAGSCLERDDYPRRMTVEGVLATLWED